MTSRKQRPEAPRGTSLPQPTLSGPMVPATQPVALSAKSPIMKSLDDLSFHLSEFEADFARLAEQLMPVMAPAREGGEMKVPVADETGMVASMIDVAAYRVAALQHALMDIRERLQV